MRNADRWTPSKFVYRDGKLRATRDRNELDLSSRLAADLIAGLYHTHLKRFARGRLIDLGCGKVPLYASYRSLVTSIVCVDWGKTPHQNPYLDLEWDLNERLPFDDASFDTVILSDVLEHISRPEELWGEMSRILGRGGHLLMNVPFYYWVHEEPNDYYRYTEFALRRFAELSGFEVVALKPIGGTPEIVADLLAKHLARLPLVGPPLAVAIQWLTVALVRTTVGGRISARTAAKFPFGYFLVAKLTSAA